MKSVKRPVKHAEDEVTMVGPFILHWLQLMMNKTAYVNYPILFAHRVCGSLLEDGNLA